eukprot:TRINITY_DN28545_c0_g1_i1.p1 TRINITY_DN28545_c0_g1~~TRINITY_DN28545_c0_g1_i1.p1  ORF type:complete len:436 (+),score=91.71 TRINITY_DN28545_c0_g1_i1:84-1391(+)
MPLLPARHSLSDLCFPNRAAVAAAGLCGRCQREEYLLRGVEEARIEVELREAYDWYRIALRRACLQAAILRNHRAVMEKVNAAAEHLLLTGGPRAVSIHLRFDSAPTADDLGTPTPFAGLVGSGSWCTGLNSMRPGASLCAISDELSRWAPPHAIDVNWSVGVSGVQLLIAQNPSSAAAARRNPPDTIQICQPLMDCDGYYVHLGESADGDPVWERAGQIFCGPSRFAALSSTGDWRFTDKRDVALGPAPSEGDPSPPFFRLDPKRVVAHQVGRVSGFRAGEGEVLVGGTPAKLTPQQLPSVTVEGTLTYARRSRPRQHPLLPLIVWAMQRSVTERRGAAHTPPGRAARSVSRDLTTPDPSERPLSPLSVRAPSSPPVGSSCACTPATETSVRWPCIPVDATPLAPDLLRLLAQCIPHPDNTAVAGLCSFLRWGR